MVQREDSGCKMTLLTLVEYANVAVNEITTQTTMYFLIIR